MNDAIKYFFKVVMGQTQAGSGLEELLFTDRINILKKNF